MLKNKYWKWTLCVGIILLFLFLFKTNSIQTVLAIQAKQVNNHQTITTNIAKGTFNNIAHPKVKQKSDKDGQAEDSSTTDKKQLVERKISHEEITQLTDEFMHLLVQEIDEDYQVIHYHSKAELLQAFEQVTLKEVAKDYVDFYYYEDKDQLYIVPTETPPWFVKQKDYNMVQLDHNKVEVTQNNSSNLYGDYTIQYEFTYDNGWKITNITHS